MAHWLIGDNIGLSVAFASFGSLLFLSSAFLGALAVLDDFVYLAHNILSVGQEVSIFVYWRVPRRHNRSVDVGNIGKRDKTFAIGPVDLFYWPVPLKLCLASFGTFSNLGWLVGIRVLVRPRVANPGRRPWFVSVGEGGSFGEVPREVWSEILKKGNHQ